MEVLESKVVVYGGRRVRAQVVRYPLPPRADGVARSITTRIVDPHGIGSAPLLDRADDCVGEWEATRAPQAVSQLVGYGPGRVPAWQVRLVRLPDVPMPRSALLRWQPRIGEHTGGRRAHDAAASRLAPGSAGPECERVAEWWRVYAAAAETRGADGALDCATVASWRQ